MVVVGGFIGMIYKFIPSGAQCVVYAKGFLLEGCERQLI